MVRRRVDVRDYERERRGRREHVRDYTREQDVRAARDESPPSLMPLRRQGAFPRTAQQRQAALMGATRELGVLQRRVNSRNSTAPFAEAVDELMASLRRGDPDMRLANDLAAHVHEIRDATTFRDSVRHDLEFAEEHPGYVAHGYATRVPGAYDILDSVRHKVVFEYGGDLPGSVTALTAENPPGTVGIREGGGA